MPLEVEHIVPKQRGGTNRVSNLALACHKCNQAKNNRTAAEFGYPQVQDLAQKPLKDAAALNTTRWELYRQLLSLGKPIECGTGATTKFNRTQQNLPKTHWIDAACVGSPPSLDLSDVRPLTIQATGFGNRQMCRMDKYGFPRTFPKKNKRVLGFQTGDIVRAVVPRGKKIGTYVGRLAVRSSGNFNITTSANRVVQGISHRFCKMLQSSDGYLVFHERMALPPLPAVRGFRAMNP